MSEQAFDSSLDLLRRLDPKNISKNLEALCRLVPDIAEDLLQSVDTPLQIAKCTESGKAYLTCDYNRDGDSFRSPWSNKYYPKLDDDSESPYPSTVLRQLEVFANDSIDIYRDLYYEGGLSSVYLWDLEEEEFDNSGKIAFAGIVLLKKQIDDSLVSGSSSSNDSGCWDSIHVFEVEPTGSSSANYKITSTVILDISSDKSKNDEIYLSGNLTRQTSKELKYKDSMSHINNIGSMIEDIETKLRNMLQEVYFGKTKDILGDLRSIDNLESVNKEKERQKELVDGMKNL